MRSPPPPPPPGYRRVDEPWVPGATAIGPTSFAPSHRFPLPMVPPLAALAAVAGATAYAAVYTWLRWGEIERLDVFLTEAAPYVLGSVPDGRISASGLPGTIIALLLALVTTTTLAALSGAGAGRRLLAGALVSVPTAAFTVALTLIGRGLTYAYLPLGDQLLFGALGAAVVGFLGGLLGALLSLAVRRPPPSSRSNGSER